MQQIKPGNEHHPSPGLFRLIFSSLFISGKVCLPTGAFFDSLDRVTGDIFNKSGISLYQETELIPPLNPL